MTKTPKPPSANSWSRGGFWPSSCQCESVLLKVETGCFRSKEKETSNSTSGGSIIMHLKSWKRSGKRCCRRGDVFQIESHAQRNKVEMTKMHCEKCSSPHGRRKDVLWVDGKRWLSQPEQCPQYKVPCKSCWEFWNLPCKQGIIVLQF
jgi:hypothetical protein